MKDKCHKPGIAVPRQRKGVCGMKKKETPEDRAVLAAKVSAELAELAAGDAVTAELLVALHHGLRLWRLCADRRCGRARGCRGEVIACAAKSWPAFSAVLESIMQNSCRGRAAGRLVAQRLLRWKSEGGVQAEPRGVVVRHRVYRGPWDVPPRELARR
jgi:hypothetical protein